MNARFGVIYHPFGLVYPGNTFNLASININGTNLPYQSFPGTSATDSYAGLAAGNTGQVSEDTLGSTSVMIAKTLQKHSLRFGFEGNLSRYNVQNPQSGIGVFNFNRQFTQQNSSGASGANCPAPSCSVGGDPASGNAIASMLLGYASSGTYGNTIAYAMQQKYLAFYVQDDFRVNAKLTINAGLRWDYESPFSERFNRLNAGFCLTCATPGITGLPVTGGLTFVATSASPSRYAAPQKFANFQPRLGAAYQITPKIVLRAGVGLIYYNTQDSPLSQGYSNSTSYVSTTNSVLPSNPLTNPWPTGVMLPTGNTLGLATQLGQGLTYPDPNAVQPKIWQWSTSMQFQLPYRATLQLAYVGDIVGQLPINKQIDDLPASFMGTAAAPPQLRANRRPQRQRSRIRWLVSCPDRPSTERPSSSIFSMCHTLNSPESLTTTSHTVDRLYNALQVTVSKQLSNQLHRSGQLHLLENHGYHRLPQSTGSCAVPISGRPAKRLRQHLGHLLPPNAAGQARLGAAPPRRMEDSGRNALRRRHAHQQPSFSSAGATGGSQYGTSTTYAQLRNPKTATRSYTRYFNTCWENAAGVLQYTTVSGTGAIVPGCDSTNNNLPAFQAIPASPSTASGLHESPPVGSPVGRSLPLQDLQDPRVSHLRDPRRILQCLQHSQLRRPRQQSRVLKLGLRNPDPGQRPAPHSTHRTNQLLTRHSNPRCEVYDGLAARFSLRCHLITRYSESPLLRIIATHKSPILRKYTDGQAPTSPPTSRHRPPTRKPPRGRGPNPKAPAPHHPAVITKADDPILRGFRTPPQDALLRCYWWWLNGHTTKDTITRDLTEMQRKGYGGVLLVDAGGADQNGNNNVPAGPQFGSPEWTALYLHALKVANQLGLEVTLNITSGWNLGGPWVKPENASKLLTWSRTTITPGTATPTKLAAPPETNNFYRQIAVLAYPLDQGPALPGQPTTTRKPLSNLRFRNASDEMNFSMPDATKLLFDSTPSATPDQDANLDQVQNITAQTDPDGTLHWTPPANSTQSWEILRIGYTSSDARVSTSSDTWQGLSIDYLDPTALDLYWNTNVLPLLTAAKPYLGTTLKYLATDSWEAGGTNWTPAFREEFIKRRGYDPIPYLPIVAGRIVGSRDLSIRFLNDLRRTVADLINAHYDHLAALSKPFGLGTQCESGGPHGAPFDALETFRSAAIVQTEYWAMSKEHRSADQDRFFVKEAAAAAHIYGKPLAAAEGMTSIGNQWNESLGLNLKPSFDQALTEGMNRLVWHEFTSSPRELGLPGQEYFAGTHLNPNVTWWRDAAAFTIYLNRAQFLLQQGQPVNDVLYYYGDNVPNFVRLKRDDPAQVLPGYDYDVTSTDALLDRIAATSADLHTPEGIHYKAFVLPKSRSPAPRRPPTRPPIPPVRRNPRRPAPHPPARHHLRRRHEAVRRHRRPLDRLRTIPHPPHHRRQRPALLHHQRPRSPPNPKHRPRRRIPQTSTPSTTSTATFRQPSKQRKANQETDIYFIRNTQPTQLQTAVTLRIANKQPELLNAVTGEATTTLLYTATPDNRTTLPLTLEPYGSIFILFRHPAARHVTKLTQNNETLFDATTNKLP